MGSAALLKPRGLRLPLVPVHGYSITAPLLQPLRARLPALGGLDLSPMAALMGLQLVIMLGVTPLRDFGLSLL